MTAPLRIRNERTGAYLGTRVRVADRMLSRLRGLLGAAAPETGEGLLITPCNGVHMLGMRYALDVVFLDREGSVVRTCERLAPGHMVPWVRHAHAALELPVGAIEASGTRVGDRVRYEPAEASA
jgi:uncharacterized membrane protein (UPF0127 family)